jgi:caffeoyl-CoA O-methyltransferase
MDRRAFGASLAGIAVPAWSFAQGGRQQAAVPNRPPVAKTEAEKRILAVLEQMRSAGELFQAVPAENGRMLRLLAETAGTRNAIEIGTSTGYSALWLCLAMQSTGGKLTTFEIDTARAAQARRHFEQAGTVGMVTLVVGNAHDKVGSLKEPIDVLFLDADKEGYVAYLQTLLPLVRPGGLIMADNVAMAEDYVRAITTDPRLDTVFFGRFAATLKKR